MNKVIFCFYSSIQNCKLLLFFHFDELLEYTTTRNIPKVDLFQFFKKILILFQGMESLISSDKSAPF